MQVITFFKKYAGKVIALASLLFLFLTIRSLNWEFSELPSTFKLIKIIGRGILLQLPVIFLVGLGWKFMLDFISGRSNPYKQILPIHLVASVSKYVPGNVFEFVARNLMANKLGLNHMTIFLSSISEALLGIFIFGVIAIILIALGLVRAPMSLISQVNSTTIILLSLLGLGVAFMAYREVKKNILKSDFGVTRIRFAPVFKFILINVVILALSAKIFVQIYHSIHMPGHFTHTEPINNFEIAGLYLIAYFAGYVIPGAPGGLGVREATMVLLLAPYVSQNKVIVAAFILRLIHIAGDFLGFAIGKYLEARTK